jgi:hypothetical protein
VLAPENSKRISSRNTFFLKRLFPPLWFGVLGLVVLGALVGALHGTRATPLALILVGPLIMMVLGYALMRRLVFDLADAVYDEGQALRVRRGSQEEHIALENIMNISYAGLTNPPRVTLTLRQPGQLGREITFSPIQKLFGPLLRTSNPIVTDLIERVDAARRR